MYEFEGHWFKSERESGDMEDGWWMDCLYLLMPKEDDVRITEYSFKLNGKNNTEKQG